MQMQRVLFQGLQEPNIQRSELRRRFVEVSQACLLERQHNPVAPDVMVKELERARKQS